jgi:hypothetical protein
MLKLNVSFRVLHLLRLPEGHILLVHNIAMIPSLGVYSFYLHTRFFYRKIPWTRSLGVLGFWFVSMSKTVEHDTLIVHM